MASIPVEKMKQEDDAVRPVEPGGHDANAAWIDPIREAKLTRKMDIFLVSLMGILYLLAFLDRGNIGNANVATPSISKSLGLNANEFNAAVSVVYATYVVFEPVWSNLLKIVTPKIVLSCSTGAWGILTIATAFAHNYKGLLAIRIILGIFEAGLFPCITVYVLMTYRREEFGRRMSYIFACAAGSGAFGGLIAFGLVHITEGRLVGWQYLYIVEGIISFMFAPITYFWLPNRVDEAWFLTEDEKEGARIRYEINKLHYDPDEKFSWRQVGRGAMDWKTYVTGAIQFCGDITLYGVSTFMPAIIKGLGYSDVNAQLLTVPVYFVGAVSFIIIARLSDHLKLRSPFIALSFAFMVIGYAILIGVERTGGRYAGVYIVALGLYGVPGLNVSWVSGNAAGHYKRVTSLGLNQLIGNCAGAAIGTIYSSTLAPRYLRSMYISIAMSGLGFVLTIATALILRSINKKRDKLVTEGAPDQPQFGDDNVHFRYLL